MSWAPDRGTEFFQLGNDIGRKNGICTGCATARELRVACTGTARTSTEGHDGGRAEASLWEPGREEGSGCAWKGEI